MSGIRTSQFPTLEEATLEKESLDPALYMSLILQDSKWERIKAGGQVPVCYLPQPAALVSALASLIAGLCQSQ